MNIKVRKIATLCLAIIVLIQVMAFSVFAASGTGYIFTFTWDNLNTRPAGSTTVLRHLWNMGYDAGEYLNNGAPGAYSDLQNSEILVIASHGAPGLIQLGTENNKSYIGANNIYSGGNNRSISNLSATALSRSKLVLYVGCNTGLTSASYGNLVTMTHTKGAKCVVGWNTTIHQNPLCDWVRLLFEKANQDHEVLWECFNHADYWVKDIWGNVGWSEMNSRNEAGNITQYLHQ